MKKNKVLVIAALSTISVLMTGCGAEAPSTDTATPAITTAKPQAPVDPNDPQNLADQPPVPPEEPIIPPDPQNPPPPPPTPLSCYVNNYVVYCSGGNIQGGLVQMDTNYMFIGNSPYFQATVTSVVNDVNANVQGAICPQPSCANYPIKYYPHSVCIHAMIYKIGTKPPQTWNVTFCGDAVDEVKKVLEEI